MYIKISNCGPVRGGTQTQVGRGEGYGGRECEFYNVYINIYLEDRMTNQTKNK